MSPAPLDRAPDWRRKSSATRRPYPVLATAGIMASKIAGTTPHRAHRREDIMYPASLDSVPEGAGIPCAHRSNPPIIANPRCPTVRTIAMCHRPHYREAKRNNRRPVLRASDVRSRRCTASPSHAARQPADARYIHRAHSLSSRTQMR
jgi:hypothetical protein